MSASTVRILPKAQKLLKDLPPQDGKTMSQLLVLEQEKRRRLFESTDAAYKTLRNILGKSKMILGKSNLHNALCAKVLSHTVLIKMKSGTKTGASSNESCNESCSRPSLVCPLRPYSPPSTRRLNKEAALP